MSSICVLPKPVFSHPFSLSVTFSYLFLFPYPFLPTVSAAQPIGWVLLLAAAARRYSQTNRPGIRVCCILSLPSDALGVPYIPCLCLRHRSPLSSPGPCSRKAPIRSAFAVPLDNPPEMPTTLLFFPLSKSSTLRGNCSTYTFHQPEK